MTFLEQLKQQVAKDFEGANDKESIDRSTKYQQAIEQAEKEEADLLAKNAELIKSYKDLVQHTSFNESPSITDNPANTAPSFESALATFIESQKDTSSKK